MTVHIPKLNTGEHFKDLQMLTLLLGKRGRSSHPIPNAPLIEVINGESLLNASWEGILISIVTMVTGDESAGAAASDEDQFDWEMDQKLPAEEEEVSIHMCTLLG